MDKTIHEADKRMYWQERQDVANNGVKDELWHQDLRATRKVKAQGMPPYMARRMFLTEYQRITNDETKVSGRQTEAA